MAYLNEILFIVTTLILWGLVAISIPLVKQGRVFQSESFWFMAFVFRASAFSFFTIASSVHFGLLTLANTLLFASSLHMALFFRFLRRPESKQFKWLPSLAILVFGLIFEYIRQQGEFQERVFFALTIMAFCLIWQLLEMRLLGQVRLKKLKLFFFTSCLELVLVLTRLGGLYFHKDPPEINLFQEPIELALIRWAWFSVTIISYVALIGYWIDRISTKNAQIVAENNSIKLAIANKKIDQSEKQLLLTLEDFKSAEVKLDVAQNELLKREELLRHVLDISGNGIWDWNIFTGEVKHNTRWIEMLGEDPSKQYFSVDDFKSRIHPDDLSAVLKQLSQTLEGLKDYQYRYRMIRLDGSQIWVEDKGKVVETSPEGKPVRMVGAITDISEEVTSNEKLQALAFYDPLTKVLNRRLFEDRLDQTLKNAERHQQFGALLILDLDKFKDLNDTYGHQIGDFRLVEVAKRMKDIIPEVDTIARMGGDEFAIILSELGSEYSLAYTQANNIAEKLCQSLSTTLPLERTSDLLSLPKGSKQYSCSASIGITLFLGSQLTQSELLAQADFAMYQAKKAGGNQVCFYSHPAIK